MKKHFFKAILPVLLVVTAIFIIGSGCGPSPVAEPDPIPEGCNFAGYTATDTSNNMQTQIPDGDLTTDFFYTSSNGPEVEIYQTSNPGGFWFLTTVVTANDSGTGTLSIGGVNQTVNVTCKRTGSAVGEQMRYDITGSTLEAEFCVIINLYH